MDGQKLTNPVQQLCEQREYCTAEMQRIRECGETKIHLQKKNMEAAEQSIAMILLYCPEDLRDQAQAVMYELGRRKLYLDLKI